MKLVDYFTEFDRILSLLLIALLGAAVGLRAAFITQYSQLPLPLETVSDANSLINGIMLLENEKQVEFALSAGSISSLLHVALDACPQLLSIITILVHFKLLYYCEVHPHAAMQKQPHPFILFMPCVRWAKKRASSDAA